MFWGLILKTNKKYSQTLKTSFHLSQASLDESAGNDEPVQVMYMQDDNAYLLCTLQKNKTTQCALDLNFASGDKVCFSTKGNGIVHLTGFLVPDEMDFDDELDDEIEGDEELEGSDLDEDDVINAVDDLRNKLKKNKKETAKKPVEAEESDDDEESGEEEESSGDDDESDEEQDTTMEADEDDSQDDDSEDDEDEDDSDEEVEEPKAKQMKLEKDKKKQPQQQNGLQNGHKEEQKKQKKDKENKQQQQQQQQKSNESGKMQKLQGGLMFQDLKVGKGNEAKPGKKIQVYYEGRLQSNNKMFDSTKQGPGFKFTLGRNEVIRGWDLGVSGMKVGGKRKLVIPAPLAYGSKGSPPVIPPNSTLVFEVELKNVLN